MKRYLWLMLLGTSIVILFILHATGIIHAFYNNYLVGNVDENIYEPNYSVVTYGPSVVVFDNKSTYTNQNTLTINRNNINVANKTSSQPELKDVVVNIVPKYYNKQTTIQTTNKKPKASIDPYLKKYSESKRKYLLKVRPYKIKALKIFFGYYHSPLAKYAEEFVHASEYYGIDYRLLPSISIVESSGGKYLFKPYNPFGWGNKGYKSFKYAIWDVSRGLSVYYYKLNRRTPELIGQLYNPVTPQHWSAKVRYLMNTMPKY